ncbi:hypothetical protein [Rhodopirellula sp. MGV]|uniref:hypothetical protein n=1 Tax=Rhodopirellula sp. MGV TaxID=2023130 RepID=UPI000B964B81|nr:hypothetical protein [Rhodopirellula sp. MGV]OYP36783.1 hypothetical protein CGZ80_06955 [Rhodopirellula sp. MGV]PNY37514.1 hypothetical protein C2E31_07220 [Rhodopirellula baltica]
MKPNVKLLAFVFAAIALLASVVGVWLLRDSRELDFFQVDDASFSGGPLMLDPLELGVKKKLAEEGDGEAAYLVYQHYAFGLDDTKRAQPWLERSVAAEYPIAIKALANLKQMNTN